MKREVPSIKPDVTPAERLIAEAESFLKHQPDFSTEPVKNSDGFNRIFGHLLIEVLRLKKSDSSVDPSWIKRQREQLDDAIVKFLSQATEEQLEWWVHYRDRFNKISRSGLDLDKLKKWQSLIASNLDSAGKEKLVDEIN